MQESKPLKISSDTEQFTVARSTTRIVDGTYEDIAECLRYCIALVGIRAENIPAGLEKELLKLTLIKQFGNHTTAEIRLAFEMAIAGKLDCDPRPFENFSPLYLSTIMVAYRKWAATINREIESKVPELPSSEVDPVNVMEELYELHVDDAAEGKLRMEFCQVILYDFMVWKQQIIPTASSKKEFFERAVNHIRWSIATDQEIDWKKNLVKFNEAIEQKKTESLEYNRAVNTAKKMMIYYQITGKLNFND